MTITIQEDTEDFNMDCDYMDDGEEMMQKEIIDSVKGECVCVCVCKTREE